MSESSPPAPEVASSTERERLRAVLRLLPVGVFLADASGRLVETNAAAEALWGGRTPRADDISAYGQYEAWWPDTGRRLEAHEWGMARALQHGETVLNQELDIAAFDGSRRTLLNSATPLYGPDGPLLGAVAVNVDITERKVAERAEALLVPDITPEWLERHARSPEHWRMMEELAPRSMIALPLVRGERRFGLITLISTSLARRYTPRDLTYAEELARRAALAVDNAWLYREMEGAVAARDEFVAIATHELRTPLSALPLQRSSPTAVIAVRDWGPGIPHESQARIFERFERATGEHAHASLGLGLYISRQIARAHGGELTVEDPSDGPGARFVLRLPRG